VFHALPAANGSMSSVLTRFAVAVYIASSCLEEIPNEAPPQTDE
jgi:hypothetical protein